MQVTRLDLDGAGSPAAIVTKILKHEPGLVIPVPIEELAYQLDIGEIADLETDGFEGGLVTDDVRSFGGILIRKGMERKRRRFTIGHELGHFLSPFHKPIRPGQFLCASGDMVSWPEADLSRAARMEAEANQFAALLLMPPPHLRKFIQRAGDPDLKHVLAIHEAYDVSKDAAARAYAQYHEQKLAIAVIKDGVLLRFYRDASFPRLRVWNGDKVPRETAFHYVSKDVGAVSTVRQIGAENWLETTWGQRSPNLYEQVMTQSYGYAMIMLWADVREEEFDLDDDRTSKQRFAERSSRWNR